MTTSSNPLPSPTGVQVPGHQTVRSVVKASQLLLRVAGTAGQTAAQLASAAEIPLPTAYNLLNTLLAEGFLTRDSARRYYLGPKIAALSVAYQRAGVSEEILSAVRRLADTTGETVYLSGWQDGSVVALAAIEGSNAVHVGRIRTELRGHEHARASGKLLLAYLDPSELDTYLSSHRLEPVTPFTITDESVLRSQLQEIRRHGMSSDDGELIPDVACVAAPLLESGICVAALTISAPLERMRQNRNHLSSALVAVAKQLSHD